jgi:hypothetical protein
MLELNYNLKVITYLNFLVQDIKEFIYWRHLQCCHCHHYFSYFELLFIH